MTPQPALLKNLKGRASLIYLRVGGFDGAAAAVALNTNFGLSHVFVIRGEGWVPSDLQRAGKGSCKCH